MLCLLIIALRVTNFEFELCHKVWLIATPRYNINVNQVHCCPALTQCGYWKPWATTNHVLIHIFMAHLCLATSSCCFGNICNTECPSPGAVEYKCMLSSGLEGHLSARPSLAKNLAT